MILNRDLAIEMARKMRIRKTLLDGGATDTCICPDIGEALVRLIPLIQSDEILYRDF